MPKRIELFGVIVAVLAAAGSGGCVNRPELVPPEKLVSPYSTTASKPLWAVAPMANETGTTAADTLAVTDAVVARSAEIQGITVLPLNRTLAVMRALNMPAITSPADARRLADALGADSIMVGTVTAYDPYDPPKLGLTLALYSRGRSNPLDLSKIRSAAADVPVSASGFGDQPSSLVSEYLDGQNHEVLMNLRRYAEGRHDPSAALGWRRYTASMELFTEFAAYWSVLRLLEEERLKAARTTVAASTPAPAGQGR